MNDTSDLINRHNIVQFFYDALPELTVCRSSSSNCMVYEIKDILRIERFVDKNMYFFSMYLTAFLEETTGCFNSLTGSFEVYEKEITELATVMAYKNGRLEMVSASDNDDWLQITKKMSPSINSHSYSNVVDAIETKLNLSFSKLPLSEEAHFQQITIDPLVLELKYCLMFDSIINFINSIGTIVQVSPSLKAHLLFKGKFRGDA